MVRFFWIFVLYCISCITLQAQNEVLIPIVNHKVFYLDSRGSTLFSGSHTTVLELDLPVNTVRWYYRFYNITKKDLLPKYGSKTSLMDELEAKLTEPDYSTLKLPQIPAEFRNKVSVYLLDDSSQASVLNKQLTFSKLKFQEQFSSLNLAAGWSEVCDPDFINGKQYLGLLNQANLSGTNMVVDVVAICKQRTIETGWSEETLKEIENGFIDGMISRLSPFVIRKVSECYIKSLQNELTYEKYQTLSVAEKSRTEKSVLDNCYHEGFLITEKDTLIELDPYFMAGSWETEKDELLEMKFSNELTLRKKNGTVLKGSWYIAEESLFLKFDNYKTQKYQPVVLSPNKYIWKNFQTGNYLRYSRKPISSKP